MAVRVNAESLSEITEIASNPPKFPRNPIDKPRKPLILYIARVPGSRDIILTTLKPLTKTVTAQDVLTCLYYFHVNSDKDTPVSPKYPLENPVKDSVASALLRKPLPPTPRENTRDNRLSPTAPLLNSKSHSIRRKPVAGSTFPIQPPPLGDKASLGEHPYPRSPSTSATEKKVLPESDFQNNTLKKTKSNPDVQSCQKQNSLEHYPRRCFESEKSENTFLVTIIRRDPSSGAQWNIGSISGHPMEESKDGRSSSKRVRRPNYDLSVSLTTPGYASFRGQSPFINETRNQNLDSGRESHQNSHFSFDRKVRMEGSNFWSRASAQRKRALSDFSDKYGTCGFRTPESVGHTHERKDQEKGYVFTSPWGGCCKFITGSGGRSLRCQHTLPSPISANSMDTRQQSVTISELRFNLSISLLTYSTSSQLMSRNPDFFSESQYNDIRNKINRLKFKRGPPLTHRSRSAFGFTEQSGEEECLVRSRSHVSMDERERDRFEKASIKRNSLELNLHRSEKNGYPQTYLNLGSEKAGGGSSGKCAKLGKIIIYDEGLKMLDLVISANIAIWWSIWERS